MTPEEIKFFRVSFDRIEKHLERIAVLLEKKPRQTRMPLVEHGAQKLVDLWNEWKNPEFSSVNGISASSTRHRNAAARYHEKPDEKYWVTVIQKINASKFCNGDNDRKWVADFEFLVRPDVHFRVLEGKYDHCHKSKNETKKIIVDPDFIKSHLLTPLPE